MPQDPQEPHFTAWHVCLVQLVKALTDPTLLEVRDFDKLGSLPLEADIILLRKAKDIDLCALAPDLDFLLKFLVHYMVVEFKSPDDYLTLADFDVVRAYAFLCKRKYQVESDEDVRIALLYSHVAVDFFEGCERNGYPFAELDKGIRCCDRHPLRIFAVNLMEVGAERPDNLINLVSARHRQFIRSSLDRRRLAIINQVRYLISRKERIHGMPVQELQGYKELTEDLAEIERRFMQDSSVDARVEGLSLEERLRGLTPEDLVHLEALLKQRKS